jgi:TonB family protein
MRLINALLFYALTIFVLSLSIAQAQTIEYSSDSNSTSGLTQEQTQEQARSLKPRIVYRPALKYPAPAVGSRVTGLVKLELLVDSEGVLEEAKILETDPVGYGFAEAATEYAKRLRFVPPQVSEINVRSMLKMSVRFTAKMLIEELQTRGLFEEAEQYQKRTERAKGSRLDSSEISVFGAYEDSTDVIGLSIHHLVDGPSAEIVKARELPMPPVEGPVGEVEGLVLEQGTRRPIANASVRFNGFDVVRSTTPWGRFRFTGVPVGRLSVMVNRPGYASQSHVIIVEPGSAKEVRKIFLKPLTFSERQKVGQHIPPRSPTRHHIHRDEIQAIAGVDSDFLKAARDLPGLYRAPFDLNGPVTARSLGARQWGGSGEVVFRGGIEGGAYILNTPMLTLSHLNHSRTLLPAAMISDVTIEADYAVEVGRLGGGLMEINLSNPHQDDRQIEAELNAFELSGVVGGPISSKTSITGAIKLGVMRFLQTQVGAEEWLKYGVQIPNSQDAHLLINHSDGAHHLMLLSTWHNSGWQNDFESPDLIQPQLRGDVGQSQNGVSIRAQWRYNRPEKQLNNTLSVSYELLNSYQNVANGHILDQSLNQFFVADRLKLRLAKPLWLSAGIEQQMTYSYIAQQGATLWSEGMGRAVNRFEAMAPREDKVFAFSPSLWTGLEGRWTQVHFLLGSRVTYWSETEEVTPEPRVTLRYTPAFGTILKLGSGLYTQQLRPRYFDYFMGAGHGNRNGLKQTRILSSSAGFEQRFTREIYIDMTGFYRQLSNRLVADQDPTVRFKSTGEGEAWGGEFLVRYDPDARYFGWVSYGFTRARFKDSIESFERRGDYDQTHNLSTVAGVKVTPQLSLNARWRFISGSPYSALPIQTFDSDLGQESFAYSPVNTTRYSAFHQLDLRLDYRWVFKEWSLLSYLQVNNAYDHRVSEIPHPLEGLNSEAPSVLQSWPLWVSIGLRAGF